MTARRLARAPASDSHRLVRALLGPSPEKEDVGEATVAARLNAMLPPVRLTDMLEEVDRWTGFIALFGHVQTGRPPVDRRIFLAALIAEATNLGLARMARVCDRCQSKAAGLDRHLAPAGGDLRPGACPTGRSPGQGTARRRLRHRCHLVLRRAALLPWWTRRGERHRQPAPRPRAGHQPLHPPSTTATRPST